MSVNVERRVVEQGQDDHVEAAWQLKERIRREEDVLKQCRGFFADAYRRATVYLYATQDDDGERLIGFAAARRDGYILFLAIVPEFRGQGFGERLVGEVAEDHRSVTCHARTTNGNALDFYDHLGFEVKRRIDRYYEDGGSAYYLKLADDEGLTDRFSKFVSR